MKTKYIIIGTLFVFSSLLASEIYQKETEQYDALFNEISQKRIGFSEKSIDSVKTPFMYIKQEESFIEKPSEEVSVDYVFYALLNDNVKINSNWYKIGESIDSYKIVKINKDKINLVGKNKTIELSLRKTNEKIFISTK